MLRSRCLFIYCVISLRLSLISSLLSVFMREVSYLDADPMLGFPISQLIFDFPVCLFISVRSRTFMSLLTPEIETRVTHVCLPTMSP